MSRYIPLSKQRFTDQFWSSPRDYRHVSAVTVVPIIAPEIGHCIAHLPLAFVSDATGKASLCAVTGLSPNQNHCLDAAYNWCAGYVPSVLRTHPFQLLRPPQGKGTPDQLVLCVDVESPWVAETGNYRFFASDGMDVAVARVFEFLTRMSKHQFKTAQAVAALADADVLTDWFVPDSDGTAANCLMRIDEAALRRLSGEQLVSLQKSGALSIAYAQMLSTHQLSRLQELALKNDSAYSESSVVGLGSLKINTFSDDVGDFDISAFVKVKKDD